MNKNLGLIMPIRVIDTIEFKSSWTHRYPEIEARGEGVMAILDPDQIQVAPEVHGRPIKISRPNGSVGNLVATLAEEHHSVVGIFFQGVGSEEVPRGSELEW